MKTVSVRIKSDQARQFREIASNIPGSSINALAQRAAELWLAIEGPVYIDAFKEAREKLERRERQPVRSEGVR